MADVTPSNLRKEPVGNVPVGGVARGRSGRPLLRSSILRILLLAVSAPVLAACGGKNDDAKRAVSSFNRGDAPARALEFMAKSGPVSSCRIAPQPQRSDQLLLTMITKNGSWLQATIDPDATLPSHDVTTGGGFDPRTEAEYRTRGDACKVSPADGSVSLE